MSSQTAQKARIEYIGVMGVVVLARVFNPRRILSASVAPNNTERRVHQNVSA